jgi:hypothetical protein
MLATRHPGLSKRDSPDIAPGADLATRTVATRAVATKTVATKTAVRP